MLIFLGFIVLFARHSDGKVSIVDRHPDPQNPLLKNNDFDIVLTATVNFSSCFDLSLIVESTRKWSVELLDLKSFSILDVLPDESLLVDSSKNILRLPAGKLDYGSLFKFSFTVTVRPACGGEKWTDFTYVKTEKRAMTAVLTLGIGGAVAPNALVIGSRNNLILVPALILKYRNMFVADKMERIEYFCRLISNSDAQSVSKVQCPKQNFGQLDNINDGQFIIHGSDLIVDQTYEFLIKIYVKDEVKTSSLIIKVIPAQTDLLELNIYVSKPKLVQQTSNGMIINGNDKTIFKSSCGSAACSNMENISFEWIMEYFQDEKSKRDYEPQLLSNWEKFTNGINYYELSLKPGFFEAFSNLSNFVISLRILEQNIKSTIFFSPRLLPTGGICSVYPDDGHALDIFTLYCNGWMSDSGIRSYAFYYYDGFSETRHDIAVSYDEPNLHINLPVGPIATDFRYKIQVDITGYYSEATVAEVGSVRVTPTTDSFESIQTQMNQLALSQDSTKINAFAAALGSSMAYDNGDFIVECQYCSLDYESELEEEDCPAVSDSLCASDPLCIEGKKNCEDARNSWLAKVKADVANLAFESQELNTIEELSVSVSTLIKMARSTMDGSNTYDSLNKSTQFFYSMNKILTETASACTSNMIRKTAQQMLDSIGHILKMISTDLTHPLKLDVETGKREFWQDYDGALPKDSNDIKYLEEMNQNDADLAAADLVIRQKVKNLQANMSSTLRTVKNMLLDDTAVGEESSHILRRESGVEMYTRVDLGSRIFVGNYTTVNNEFYNFTAPPFFGLEANKSRPYSSAVVAFTNIYFNNTMFKTADTKSRLNTGSLDVELTLKETKSQIPVSNAKDFFEITVGVQNETLQSTKAEVTVPSNSKYTMMQYHMVDFGQKGASMILKLTRNDPTVDLRLYVHTDLPGTLQKDHIFQTDIDSAENSSNIILDKTKLGNYTGVLYIGIAQPTNNFSIPHSVIDNETFALNFTTTYVLDILESNCYYFDKNAGLWSTRGCQPGSKSSRKISHCTCNHLTIFASGIFISPNSIDFEFVFTHLDFDKNVTIYVTITVILTIYTILVFYTKSADDKDLRKLGLTPLADNNPNDRYFYEVLVSTGMSRDSATDSKVQIILYGENEQTSIRTLEDSERPIFRNGQTNRFLLGVPRSLGFVHSIRIWHDNSGEDMLASWFLNYVIVFDLHTHEKFPFVVNRWLAVEEDDGELERCVVVSSEKDIKNFGTLFGAHSKRKLIDDHIWASIFLRPANSRFNRTERLTCCLVFLFSIMLTSAMWYGATEYAPKSDYWDLYWMKISKEELGVAIMSNIVVFPINFLIAFLFRFSSDQKSSSLIKAQGDDAAKSKSSINDFESRSINDTFDEQTENQDRTPIFRQIKFDKQEFDDNNSRKIIIKREEQRKQKEKKPFVLPAFCKNLAWLLCLVTVAASVFFLLSYAIQMGDQKTQKWLAALMLSFFTSVFFVQPLKIVIVVILLSWIFKKDFTDDVDEKQLFVKLKDDTEYKYLHKTTETTVSYDRRIFLTPHDKELYRTRRKHDLKMYDSVREIVAYGVFLIFVLIIVHHNYDQSLYRRHLGNLFGEQDAHPRSMKKVKTAANFWNYTQNVFVPAVRAQKWYNGAPPVGQRGFFADRVSRILGYATLRQIRSKANCSVQPKFEPLIKYCYSKSSIIFEDRADYGPNWDKKSNIYKPEFTYKTAKTLQSFPFYGTVDIYSGGGYVVELIGSKTEVDEKLNEIKKLNWIDRRTRALILEFSAYNAFANLFVFGRISFEFPTESGVIARAWFQPMNLLRYHTVNGQFMQFCEIVFYLYTLTFILKEIRNIRRQGFRKYIRQFWSLIEICIISSAIVSGAVYIKIYAETRQVLQIFEKSNGNEFTNLSSIGAWYQTYEMLLGFLTFLAIFKFIKILRFNRHIATINATFELVRGKLLWFGVVFFLSFTAFCSGLYLSMSSTMEIYKSMGNTFQNTFEMLLGKYDFGKLRESDRILAPFFVFLFFVTTSFVLLDLCISILMESFKQVRRDAGNHPDDYELWRFMQARLRSVLLGGGRAQGHSLDVDQQANDFTFYDKFDYKFNLIVTKIDRLMD